MAYNREIRQFAPLPTGALPTQEEIDRLVQEARQRQSAGLFSSLRKTFGG